MKNFAGVVAEIEKVKSGTTNSVSIESLVTLNKVKQIEDLFLIIAEDCPNVKILNLGLNYLGDLPINIRTITSLEELFLQHNNLESLPNSIVLLRKLKHLSLRNNNFTSIPTILQKLPELSFLYLRGNPLSLQCLLELSYSIQNLKITYKLDDEHQTALNAMNSSSEAQEIARVVIAKHFTISIKEFNTMLPSVKAELEFRRITNGTSESSKNDYFSAIDEVKYKLDQSKLTGASVLKKLSTSLFSAANSTTTEGSFTNLEQHEPNTSSNEHTALLKKEPEQYLSLSEDLEQTINEEVFFNLPEFPIIILFFQTEMPSRTVSVL